MASASGTAAAAIAPAATSGPTPGIAKAATPRPAPRAPPPKMPRSQLLCSSSTTSPSALDVVVVPRRCVINDSEASLMPSLRRAEIASRASSSLSNTAETTPCSPDDQLTAEPLARLAPKAFSARSSGPRLGSSTPSSAFAARSMGPRLGSSRPSSKLSILSLGVSPDRIIYANPCKAASFIRHAASSGVDMMTFDNADELAK
ncbi:MAG: hypothetical protein EON93_25990, partial [Burkholderiales bacterium]